MKDKESRKKLFLREDQGDYAFEFFKKQYTIVYNTKDEIKNISTNLKPDGPDLRNQFNKLIEEYSNIDTWKGFKDKDYDDKNSSLAIYKLAFLVTESQLERLREEKIKNTDRTSIKTANLRDLQFPKPRLNGDKETDLLSTASHAVFDKYNEISAFFQSIITPQPQQKNDTSRDETLSGASTKTASSQNSNSLPSASFDLLSNVHNKYLDLVSTVEKKYGEISTNIVKNLMPENTDNTPKSKESHKTNSSSLSKDSTITASSQEYQLPPIKNPENATYSSVLKSVTSIIFGVSSVFQSLISQSQQDKKESASQKDEEEKTKSRQDDAPKDPLNSSVKQVQQKGQQSPEKNINEERREEAIEKAKASAEEAKRISTQTRREIPPTKTPPEPPKRQTQRQEPKLPAMRDDRPQTPSPAPQKRKRSNSLPSPDRDWNAPFMAGDRVVARGHFENPKNR